MKTEANPTHIVCSLTIKKVSELYQNELSLWGLYDNYGILEPTSLQWSKDAPFSESKIVAVPQNFLNASDNHCQYFADELLYELKDNGELTNEADSLLEYAIPRFVINIDSTFHVSVDSDNVISLYQENTRICELALPDEDGYAEQYHNKGYLDTNIEYVNHFGEVLNYMIQKDDAVVRLVKQSPQPELLPKHNH